MEIGWLGKDATRVKSTKHYFHGEDMGTIALICRPPHHLAGTRTASEGNIAWIGRMEAQYLNTNMLTQRLAVGLLTEMDPLSNTQSSHEGTTRLLGLNRNRGEVIELRLRTDAYDGYRDYKTIRNTLCHELAHNVHGPHDRKFWDLCHQIEREVQAADWKHGGHAVSSDDYYHNHYEPSPEDDVPDHGGWTGGTYVLGRSSEAGSGSGSSSSNAIAPPLLGRRDVIAKAVEERLKRLRRPDDSKPPPGDDGGSNGEGSST